MKDSDVIARLADIQPPPAPDSGTWVVAILIVAVILAVTSIYLYRYRKTRRGTVPASQSVRAAALARLGQLEQEWQTRRIDDRQAAFRLATLLRLGLGETQWSATVGASDNERALQAVLAEQRYRRAPGIPLEQSAFKLARDCLGKDAAPTC